MLEKLATVRHLWRYLGPGWLAYRAWYAARLRSGWMTFHYPVTSWPAQPLRDFLRDEGLANANTYLDYRRTQAPAFFFDPAQREQYRDYFRTWDEEGTSPVELTDEIAQGMLRYYHHEPVATGFPPNWHQNPFTGQTAPADRHWSRIGDFGHGDIKAIWEASRFGFVYPLVRAYWRSGNEQYPALFWQLVEDWRANNPPQQGPNWKCGQETSLRVMAWCFGLYGFLHSPATTPARVQQLAQMVAISGQRIAANLRYALSQRNNHGVSEGMGLWTISLLFPELRQAARWQEKGRTVLEMLGRELIYDDGSFSQHSVNYHRLMLHDYLWCLRLGDINGRPFSSTLRQRVERAGRWLYQLQVGREGEAPQYGQIDGALILPLNSCDFQDYRPVIQATHYLCSGERCYADGPWDEDLLWLFGPDAVQASVSQPAQTDFAAESGGYYTLRTGESMVFTRCGPFHDRPAQADMLHVDLWWRGLPIAIDAGTYSYNAPPPWNNPLAATRAHNTVTVDGREQMERASKFMWLPWIRGRTELQQRAERGWLTYWQGTHDGYERLPAPVRYRRGVMRLGAATWLICDALDSAARHRYRLHWLLADWPHEWDEKARRLALHPTGEEACYLQFGGAPATLTLIEGDETSARGWHAPYYQTRRPALSLALAHSASTARFWTLFAPLPFQISCDDEAQLRLFSESKTITIRWQDKRKSLIDGITVEDKKEITTLEIRS